MTIVKRSTFSSQDNARWLLSLSEETTEDNLMHWFAICEVLSVHGYVIPEQWEFRPGAISTEDRKENIKEQWPDSEWAMMLDSDQLTVEDLIAIGWELSEKINEGETK